ncbi:MAG: type II toxin-antitoxin system HicA family toxin [bacterium]|nr:type II toxin-antitoxin system HicA family toxin [bacterium]
MSILPILSAKELLRALHRGGFIMLRQKGSHIRIRHPLTGMSTTIPLHAHDLSRKMITTILKQAGISLAEFLQLLEK